ncbi:hypothetical protein DO97_01535 [Neosynechococcus sphagnicola sy1]|uniref:Glycosyl transferase family 1 domain-containing protein n=1 Tax=Neosynechococcus sphagnicola sy1 TaxID=1497020 RepID=A0A098TQV3_9CYAN|nr:hypothetical protein DO97_01535 [Neosynechococcus sphagnicola sy1]
MEVILSARALKPFYRIHKIIQAFAAVQRQRPQTALVILDYLSQDDYRQQIQQQIQDLGLTHQVYLFENMPCPFEQMPELYAASSVMVSIPEEDGMPNSIYEAFAVGCPVVASDLKTYDGVVDHEDTCLRVNGNHPAEIAVTILRILENSSLRDRLIRNGRKKVKTHGDLPIEMQKMEQLYYQLLSQSKHQSKIHQTLGTIYNFFTYL